MHRQANLVFLFALAILLFLCYISSLNSQLKDQNTHQLELIATNQQEKSERGSTNKDFEGILPKIPNLTKLTGGCSAFNELRDVDFTSPSLQNWLCENGPAYTLVGGRFPLCQLKTNLPEEIYKAVKQTAKIGLINRANGNGAMPIHTFDAHDLISKQILEQHQWETLDIATILAMMHKVSRADPVTFLDIGSNIGAYSLQVSELGFPVVAVDANIRTLVRLQLSAKHLGILGNNLKLFWCFISDEVALKHLSWETESHLCNVGGASSADSSEPDLPPNIVVDTIPIMTARADDLKKYIKTKKIIMKMDIESGEHLFMKTGASLFNEFDIIVLQMEFWRLPGHNPQSSPYYKFITDFMLARNYALFSTTDLQPQSVENFLGWDGIWIRNDFISTLLAPGRQLFSQLHK